jgi:hypothetical protein
MSRTTSAANAGAIAAELLNWAQGRHSTEAAVELLIRAPRWEIRGAGSAMATDRRSRNHLARRRGHRAVRRCRVVKRTPHWRSSKPSQLASRSKM